MVTRPLSADGMRHTPRVPIDVWDRRHARILWVLVAHLPVLVVVSLLLGFGPAHALVDAAGPAVLALVAMWSALSPRVRSVASALGLMSAAAVVVHLADGRTEAHFLYFVLLGILALYDDWVPYAVAVGFVLLEHGILGVIAAPSELYSDGAADDSPWLLAAVHGGAVLAASLVAWVSFRWRETDRSEIDQRLAASEQRFRLTFEAAPIGISLVSPAGQFLIVNQALCSMVGYSAEELTAMDFQSITDPDDLDEDMELVRECLDGTRDSYVMEKRYLHKEGRAVWVQLNVALARDPKGRPEHFVAQILDITERHAAAAVQAEFAAMVEHGSDLISLTDAFGRVRYASPAFRTVLGIAPEDEVGRCIEDGVHPDDLAVLVQARIGLSPGASTTLRYRRSHVDGSWRWLESTLTDRVEDPHIAGYVINTRDVSEQVLALERLEHQASHDVLTGLANRARMDERLAEACSTASRLGGLVAALFVDIDHFKQVNDQLGHAAGDELLVAVADRLRTTARLHDVIARVGGDEFVILALVPSGREAEELAERINAAFDPPFTIAGSDLLVTASVGLATSECAAASGVGLLAAADAALYGAKDHGRHRWEAFRPARPVEPVAVGSTADAVGRIGVR